MDSERRRTARWLVALAAAAASCASSAPRFPLRPPLTVDTDLHSFNAPCRVEPSKKDPKHIACAPEVYVSPLAWDGIDNSIFRPLSRVFAVDPAGEAMNVNSLDEVADSAWFTNRIGAVPMSIEELSRGACEPKLILDDPTADGVWVVDQGKKNGASAGFRVNIPGKGKYLFKSDGGTGATAHPERPTAASAIGAAVYNAVGFFTSCEQIVYFKPGALKLTPGLRSADNSGIERDFDQHALNTVLDGTTKRGELVRMQASAWLTGHLLGPFRYVGTREDDANDVIDHQDRRELRGARLVAAWIDHFDAREQNTMDSWIADRKEENDSSPGYVRHYYLDTSDGLGSEWEWDGISRRLGSSYLLDWGDISLDFVMLGTRLRTWDTTRRTPKREQFGYYNVTDFDPEGWKNEYPNPAFSRMSERDGAWMARILARFTPEMVAALAKLGEFSDPGDTAFIAATLEGRLERILERYLTRLSPVADVRVEGNALLCGVDLAERRSLRDPVSFRYQASLSGGAGTALPLVRRPGGEICVRLSHVVGTPAHPKIRRAVTSASRSRMAWRVDRSSRICTIAVRPTVTRSPASSVRLTKRGTAEMRGPRAWLSRYWDIRAGEGRFVVLAFAALLLIVSAHTVLETARDALLLTRLPPRQLGIVYIAVAAVALPMAALASRTARKFGARVSLVGSLVFSALVVLGFFSTHSGPAMVIALYVAVGAIISAVVPQFWTLVDSELTTAQARRLVSPITAAGIVGGVIGSTGAAAALLVLRVKELLLVSALVFAIAAVVVATIPLDYRAPPAPAKSATVSTFLGARREEPFLRRIALLVAISTATLLSLDYFFKWTVARTVPHAEVGMLVARLYAVLNVASLVLQLVLGGGLVRRVGLAAAVLLTPLLVFLGAGSALILGGTLVVVILLKCVDGSLRYSVYRLTTELLYLPVRSDLRARAKPLIDGALMRTVQAATAGALLAMGGASFLSPRPFAAIVLAFAFAWVVTAVRTRRPYMDLLRRAVMGSDETPWSQEGVEALDLATAEVLVEFLARDNPVDVLAAMEALARRGHERLIPALILHHEDERVLVSALTLFGASTRTDWHTLARRLIERPGEAVRMAAARALALHGKLEVTRLDGDPSTRVEAYATLHAVLAEEHVEPATDPRVVALLGLAGTEGDAARLGLIAALADTPRTTRATALLLELTRRGPTPNIAEWTLLISQATASHRVVEMIPLLLARLSAATGREYVLRGLVALGDPALAAASTTLGDEKTERRIRAQIPNLLARFESRDALAILLERIETERDHLVRYKAIRALGRITEVRLSRSERARVERQAYRDLVEHFATTGRRVALDIAVPSTEPVDPRRHRVTGVLLRGLLDDKRRHSLERTFRLLKTAHPTEDLRRVHTASLSNDLHARANASEFLDALLVRREQQGLRALLRLVSDNLSPAERVHRAAPLLGRAPPETHDEALLELVEGRNATLAALALQHATATGGASLQVVEEARARRPDVDLAAARLFEDDVDGSTSRPPPSMLLLAEEGLDGG